jgi:hypothetical protein
MAKQIITPDVVCKVEKSGNRYNAWSTDGTKYTSEITHGCRKNAFNGNYLIGRFPSSNGNSGFAWRRVTDKVMAAMGENPASINTSIEDDPISVEVPSDHAEILNFIHTSYSLKPKGLMMSELKWKYLIRSAVRGKNIMMTGPAGCGKTMAAKSVVNSLDRPDFYFNLGATQDPRATLMTVLDSGQRYLRLDEQKDQATIKVADGVTFIATANIGNEYTSTRVMDKALMDRFTIVEMDVLSETEENDLLSYMFPNVDSVVIGNVAKIASLTRTEANSDTARIPSGVSTRTTVELCGLLYDGFSLQEASEVSIYPQYDNTGGVDSERTFVKQIVQKFCDDGSSDELFNEEEVEAATTA